ncbi:Rv1733c family protein [Nocardia yamanashiensis]|uniref:Rv1733c family protein n=1 Tax=Nocardia yamanashiensis TaxID=209247 RepID=UPI00082C5CF9|nr:hypothetical protein [Nocardia yamanashiensis]
MTTYPSMPVRAWRAGPWNPNPLMDGLDRVVAWAVLVLGVVMLAAVPVGAAAGTGAYSDAAVRFRAQCATKTAVPATVIADPEVGAVGDDIGRQVSSTATASVRWVRDGAAYTGEADVPAEARRGEEVTIWLDQAGQPTQDPAAAPSPVSTGIMVGLVVLLGIWGLALLSLSGLMGFRERHRAVRWEREWRQGL